MSRFDDIQKSVFNTTTNLFGDEAVWIPAAGGTAHKALVHFKNPNDPYRIGNENKYEYRPYDYSFEYYEDKFPGLKESVESGAIEKVSVKGFNLAIREIRAKFDGKTYIAYGERVYD
jgi:hypothetical protein